MKKILFVLGMMVGVIGWGQTFIYLDCTSEWRYYVQGGSVGNYILTTKYLDGDTLINNKIYYRTKVISRNIWPMFNGSTTTYYYYPTNSTADELFYLSEDSLHNFIVTNKFNNFPNSSMLYNFDSIKNLNIGYGFPQNTTYYPSNCYALDGYSKMCLVNAKDSFYLGSQLLIGTSVLNNYPQGYTGVIEGVGSGNPFMCSWDGCADGFLGILHYYIKQTDTLQLLANAYTFPYDSFPKPIRTHTCLLPLKLLSFTAQKENNNVLLNWQTANEVNVSHINIQRSISEVSGGNEFTTIGKVNVGGSRYSFLDDKLPNTNDKLTLYYRLETVDKDGSKTYSTIQQITIKPQTPNILVYPNPAKDIVTIECAGAKEILIIDYLGRTIYADKTNRTSYIVNLKSFAKGVYVVKAIMNNGEIKTEKLIVE